VNVNSRKNKHTNAESGGIMKTRKTTKRNNAIKGIFLFSALSLFPVAVLFAGQTPATLNNTLKKPGIEQSIKKWQGMRRDLSKILSKADRLNKYKVIN